MEGSRGGHVTGHTAAGKPIYAKDEKAAPAPAAPAKKKDTWGEAQAMVRKDRIAVLTGAYAKKSDQPTEHTMSNEPVLLFTKSEGDTETAQSIEKGGLHESRMTQVQELWDGDIVMNPLAKSFKRYTVQAAGSKVRKPEKDPLEAKQERQQRREAGLRRSVDDALEDLCKAGKTGAGSRGGKIVGHTSSGQPIYASGKNSNYKNFTPTDHHEAYAAHSMLSERAAGKKDYEAAAKHGKQKEYHRSTFEAHERLGAKIPDFDTSASRVKLAKSNDGVDEFGSPTDPNGDTSAVGTDVETIRHFIQSGIINPYEVSPTNPMACLDEKERTLIMAAFV